MQQSDEPADPGIARLESQLLQKKEEAETEYDDDPESVAIEKLEEASDTLKKCARLLEYLSEPLFCKAITKRDRVIMDKLVEQIDTLTDELDETVAELESEDEE